MRFPFFFSAVLLLLGAMSPMIRAADGPPNIVFIFTDDHCQQALSAYDPSRISTPQMDRIAHEGMRFDRCYVTNALCGPSRAVIQTGKYSHINGFMTNSQRFNNDQQTFPKLLQQAGYQTAVIGKWHLECTPQGYHYYDILVGQGPYYNPPMITEGPEGKPVTRPHVGYTTEIITEKALKWLDGPRDKTKPFLLMFQHKAPHRNWQPSPKYLDWLDEVTIPEPPTLFDTYEGRASVAAQQKMQVDRDLTEADLKLVAPGNLTPEQRATWDAAYESENIAFRKANLQGKELVRWKYQRYAKDYLRCVKSVDDAVGQVLDYLDQNGLADNTIVIYSTDNGWYLGEHGWFDKRWMYEESLKVPLLVRWPGHIRPGSVNGDIVSNLDFAETFLDLAGVPVPSDMQGRSLVPIFHGNTPADWRKSFYYHYYEFPGAHSVARHYGVTNGQAKLIHYYDAHEWELFDLKQDPQEMKSLYGQPEAAGLTQELKAELERLRALYQLPAEDPASSRPQPRSPAKNKGKGREAGPKSQPKAA